LVMKRLQTNFFFYIYVIHRYCCPTLKLPLHQNIFTNLFVLLTLSLPEGFFTICRYQTSQHLKSHDVHNNTYNYKFTFSVEIAGVCKVIVCAIHVHSVNILTAIHLSVCVDFFLTFLMCFFTVSRVDSTSYFASPFTAVASQKQFAPFMVVEIEEDDREETNSRKAPVGARLSRRHRPASVWLMRLNQKLDEDDNQCGMIHARTHLGHIIHVGDTVHGSVCFSSPTVVISATNTPLTNMSVVAI
uniref:ECR1_N domain-containing protein n=1 Tax=Echinostoma caproni TaxID=27848 RepID=A0A183ASE9_9TREM